VLLMVMVHVAATVPPPSLGQTTAIGYLVAGLGGLAAPLFVVLAGWGSAGKHRAWGSRFRRAALLLCAQLVVNLSAPHLYDSFTPGVLSLFALLALVPWTHPNRHVQRCTRAVALLAPLIVVAAPALQGPSSWDGRTTVNGVEGFASHLLLTGLYPLVPWCGLAWLGVMLRVHGADLRKPSIAVVAGGLVYCAIQLVRSFQADVPWAAPTSPDGQALLTFFPANGPFMIAASTGVLLLWAAGTWLARTPSLPALGRLSLTVYVLHTPLLWVLHRLVDAPSVALSTLLVLLCTLMWWPLAAFWPERHRRWSLESALSKA
jgi:hypothetical protein